MQRYFIESDQFLEDTCFLEGQDAHHLVQVMRASIDDEIICCDGNGRVSLVRLSALSKQRVEGKIILELNEQNELPIKVTIVQGIPKGDKLELVLQKGTELGLAQFIPYQASRSVVKVDEKKEVKKRERWLKIVKEAAEQSHRTILPKVLPLHSLEELAELDASCRLVAFEEIAKDHEQGKHSASKSTFFQALTKLSPGDHLLCVFGPEGGLDQKEVNYLVEQGFQTIHLGKRILRTETAPLYFLSAVSYHFEQMGG